MYVGLYNCVCLRAKKETRLIRQLQYTAWPDHGVPSSCQHFLEFVRVVQQEIRNHSADSQPTLVHCRSRLCTIYMNKWSENFDKRPYCCPFILMVVNRFVLT